MCIRDRGQEALATPQNEPLTITVDVLTINDADVDPAYHVDYALTVYGGDNYTVSGEVVTPEAGFTGTLRVPISVNDGAAESATFELRIAVGTDADTVPPVITLIGPATVTVQLGAVYTDAGATASDNVDGDISDKIEVTNPVNTATAGTYTVSYRVEDTAGNTATATRTVIVQATADTVPPVITLIGAATVTVQLGAVYTDAGATATDNVDGDITDRIVVTNPVDTATAGTYTVSYRVEDTAGNTATATRTVIVQATADTVPPVITLVGAATVTVQLGAAYTDAGATATDNVDGDITDRIVVTNPVDTATVGTYTVSYRVEDSAGNAATATRTVIVQATADTVPPEITLIGAATVTVQLDAVYTDAGATATDNVDGDISDRIVVENPVNTSIAGTYTVTYRVEDQAGNRASATRSVVVQTSLQPPPPAGGGGGFASPWLLVALLIALLSGMLRNGGVGLVGPRGIEPRTCGLRVRCSA